MILLNRRFLFPVAFFIAPLAAVAQTVTVQNLMPLNVGQYVEYNEFDTATSGEMPTVSFAYYEGLQSGLSFEGETGVSEVRDTLGDGDPFGAHNLHYHFTDAGDLQGYADSAFVNDLIPSSIAAGISQMPNAWVDYFKLSVEANSYPIMTLNSTVMEQGITANVIVTVSGKFAGIEKVTVLAGTYDSAYRFDLQAVVEISALGGLAKANFTSPQSDWLVRGIGIIKTNAPIAGTTLPQGNSVSTIGRDKEMTEYGVVGAASVSTMEPINPEIQIYPNPVSNETTLTLGRAASTIFLFNPLGQMVRSFDVANEGIAHVLELENLPNGVYFSRVNFVDGTSRMIELLIQH